MMYLSVLVSAMTSLLVVYLLAYKYPGFLLDQPNNRSLHTIAVPRTGGVGIFAAIFCGFLVNQALFSIFEWPVFIGALLIFVISFVDDVYSIRIVFRILIQFFVAIIVINGGLVLTQIVVPGNMIELLPQLAWLVTIFIIVWFINLFNFMDGMDGLSAGMAIVGFTGFAIISFQANHISFSVFCLLLAGVYAGFLVFNFPPARIFMGDAGSSSLGYFAAISSIYAEVNDIFPFWVAILIFSPFIVDSTLTLFRRIKDKENFWLAHRTHYYQRLVMSGLGHKNTLLFEYALMMFCVISAILVVNQSNMVQWLSIIFWIFFYYILVVFAENRVDKS